MKTFESEKKELFDWLCGEQKRYDDALEERRKKGIFSRDSEAGLRYQEARLEYNKKFLALKKKYNIK